MKTMAKSTAKLGGVGRLRKDASISRRRCSASAAHNGRLTSQRITPYILLTLGLGINAVLAPVISENSVLDIVQTGCLI